MSSYKTPQWKTLLPVKNLSEKPHLPPVSPTPHYFEKYDENLTWIYTDISTEYCDDKLIRITTSHYS